MTRKQRLLPGPNSVCRPRFSWLAQARIIQARARALQGAPS